MTRPRVAKLNHCKFCGQDFYGAPYRWSCAVCTDEARLRSLRKYALKVMAKARAATAARVEARANRNPL